jgi:hypothetical protein
MTPRFRAGASRRSSASRRRSSDLANPDRTIREDFDSSPTGRRALDQDRRIYGILGMRGDEAEGHLKMFGTR